MTLYLVAHVFLSPLSMFLLANGVCRKLATCPLDSSAACRPAVPIDSRRRLEDLKVLSRISVHTDRTQNLCRCLSENISFLTVYVPRRACASL